MKLPKQYDPSEVEPRLQAFWQRSALYAFHTSSVATVYSIDTPPATVSGHLHLGHTYSYSHPDFLARFWRMNGRNVFYPMGYDDNGLPTARYVQRRLGLDPTQIGHEEFAANCLAVGEEMEREYEALWRRLGLSIDWSYTYRTIESRAQRISQLSFLDLQRKGLAYRQSAPTIWCPECQTAIAQAEVDDLQRETVLYSLSFQTLDGLSVPIATTRPELLPACVAIFVHPGDARFVHLVGQQAIVPISGRRVPVMSDSHADPAKGTGAVMCCTFGDATDVEWWRTHRLPLVEAIGPDGRLTNAAGQWTGLPTHTARLAMVRFLKDHNLLLDQLPAAQSVRVHERCDTPVEYIVGQQWFIRVLDFRDDLLRAGDSITWHPSHMASRYREWVEGLRWDWCISRQRTFGVPFPVWYCQECDSVLLADESQLPVDPHRTVPPCRCTCGSGLVKPEEDVMDTWATSSLTPQIAGRWPRGEGLASSAGLYSHVFPMSLRPQAHDIIRTWAFYTIVKSLHHFGVLPWKEIAISGWGIAGEGMGKMSKSRGGGPRPPMEVIDRYGADAVRYWAASTGFGKDAVISEQKIQVGAKLVKKLWNVARFCQPFLEGLASSAWNPEADPSCVSHLTPADRWILARGQRLIRKVTEYMRGYDYAAAKSEIELFFWGDLADNYLEMAKARLYDPLHTAHEAARFAIHRLLLTVVKLLAPFLPFVCDEVYQRLFADSEGQPSVHAAGWPAEEPTLADAEAEEMGGALVTVATAVRRYKSEHSLPLGAPVAELLLVAPDPALCALLREAEADLRSITRAGHISVAEHGNPLSETIATYGELTVSVAQ